MEHHCHHSNISARNNLEHVYFFIGHSAHPADVTHHTPQKLRSRGSSRVSSGSDVTATGSASSSTSSNLNPEAATFSPSAKVAGPAASRPPHTASDGVFELRPIQGKGLGLIATTLIPRGSRIIHEKAMLGVPGDAPFLACRQYDRLQPRARVAYDQLHSYVQDLHNLQNLSRMFLIDFASIRDDEDKIDRQVDEHVRVMGTFLANRFTVIGGTAVYETAARLNHACVPNAFHGSNSNKNRCDVHAVRDIVPGEEITIDYIGAPATYTVRSQRIEYLRTNYGFTCSCEACLDVTKISDQRRELLNNICWGLEQYDRGAPPEYPFIAEGPAQAFKLAVNAVNFMSAEGSQTRDLLSALNAASKYALALHNWPAALQYAYTQQEAQLILMGREARHMVEDGTAASCWIAHAEEVVTENASKKMAKEIFDHFGRTMPSSNNTPTKKKKKSKKNNKLCP